ncbi:hypothetical protein TNCV_3836931 [Trichonephila clavipes]|nr:hypothetical protein TNCV_3836931 [Trichonephila clavipes]
MVTEDEKRVTYDNIVRKRSWSTHGEAAQTVAKLELTARKVLLRICLYPNAVYKHGGEVGTSVTIDDTLVNSEMDLVARISIAAATIRETPGIFEYVPANPRFVCIVRRSNDSQFTMNSNAPLVRV